MGISSTGRSRRKNEAAPCFAWGDWRLQAREGKMWGEARTTYGRFSTNLASRSKNTPAFTRARQLFFLFPLHRFTAVSQNVVYEKLVCEHEGDFCFTLTFTRCEPPDGVSKRGVFDDLSCVKLGEGTLKVRESLSSPTTCCRSVGWSPVAVSPRKAYLHP